MQVKVNTQLHQLEKDRTYSLTDALTALALTPPIKGVAIAVNNHVIPRAEWPNTAIADQDEILIITATQGG